jgi:hypothetical protein
MTTNEDVQWWDEIQLHRGIASGDPEAFAEMIRRFDPLVRAHVARVTEDHSLEEEMAAFWIALLGDPRLREWNVAEGGLFGQWIAAIAAQSCAARMLRRAA